MKGTFIQFMKFESTGNDFIVVDNRAGVAEPGAVQIKGMCDRRFGIGADGLILLENHYGRIFRMRYFNSDGNEGSFCGNGGRAVSAFADILEIPGFPSYRFMASDGLHSAVVKRGGDNKWLVTLGMNDVLVDRPDLIDTGSPHHVLYMDDLQNAEIDTQGKTLRSNPVFGAGGCNVDFIEDSGTHLYVRTWERGVEAETLSCGTGVTASAIFHNLGKPDGAYNVRLHTPGGELEVSYHKNGNMFGNIILSGTTTCVFSGKYYL